MILLNKNGQLTEEEKLNLFQVILNYYPQWEEIVQLTLKDILWTMLHSTKKLLRLIHFLQTVTLEQKLLMIVKNLTGYQLQMLKNQELKSCLTFQEVSKELILRGNTLQLNSKFNSLEEKDYGKVLKKQMPLIWNIHLNSL